MAFANHFFRAGAEADLPGGIPIDALLTAQHKGKSAVAFALRDLQGPQGGDQKPWDELVSEGLAVLAEPIPLQVLPIESEVNPICDATGGPISNPVPAGSRLRTERSGRCGLSQASSPADGDRGLPLPRPLSLREAQTKPVVLNPTETAALCSAGEPNASCKACRGLFLPDQPVEGQTGELRNRQDRAMCFGPLMADEPRPCTCVDLT